MDRRQDGAVVAAGRVLQDLLYEREGLNQAREESHAGYAQRIWLRAQQEETKIFPAEEDDTMESYMIKFARIGKVGFPLACYATH